MSLPKFAEVLLPFGNVLSNRPYTYSIPAHLQEQLAIGDSVWVPFRSSTASGVVIGFVGESNRPTKEIERKNVNLSPISSDILQFSKWISERYVSSWWDALRGFLFSTVGTLPEVSPYSRDTSGSVPNLTEEQQAVNSQIKDSMLKGEFLSFLLHGITGSGKTEIYLSCTEEAIRQGKQVLVLVPEIPLSFQLSKRFRDHFGEQVAIFHSGLTDKEKQKEQAKLFEGHASIGIGPRMALFAPFKNLGLVVMDEEHDTSYKQESHPRYHAFALAEKLAQRHSATLVLGTATPSVESYYFAKEGKMRYLALNNRYESRPLPEVEIVDLRSEDLTKTRPFSNRLLEAIRESIKNNQQSILFLNRRGFSPLVLCRDCGHTLYCPHCSITLTYHLARKNLRCHYCDYQNVVPDLCPKCQGNRMTHRGFGTERLEEKLKEHIPEAKILRLDRDTTSKRGKAKSILDSFAIGEANVLIGTQMVTKGFDFPNVNVVGIIFADHLLHFPDFRSGERTFQLLTQVSGRAGRGSTPGRVILQTYDPEHPVIQAAAQHDYATFYKEEIESRRSMLYPPFVSLANFVLAGPDEVELEKESSALRVFLLGSLGTLPEVSLSPGDTSGSVPKEFLLGPSPCPIQKISKNFRWHLLLKALDAARLAEISRETYVWYAENGSRKIRLTIDIDPLRLL